MDRELVANDSVSFGLQRSLVDVFARGITEPVAPLSALRGRRSQAEDDLSKRSDPHFKFEIMAASW